MLTPTYMRFLTMPYVKHLILFLFEAKMLNVPRFDANQSITVSLRMPN